MTIGIAVVLEGAVVAIADGRTSLIESNTVVRDDTQKIHSAGAGLMLISFGVTPATKVALRHVKSTLPPVERSDAVRRGAESLAAGWSHFQMQHPDAQRDATAVRAALIIAGVDPAGPFIGGAMADFAQGTFAIGPTGIKGAHMVLGAERFGSNELFRLKMNEALSNAPDDLSAEARARLVAHAGANTIREMERHDPTVGGRIHFRALFSSGSHIEGVLR